MMNKFIRYFLLPSVLMMLSACNSMPQLLWGNEEGRNESNTSSSSPTQEVARKAEVSNEVSSGVNSERSLPMADHVAAGTSTDVLPEKYKKQLKDRAIVKDERSYKYSTAELFSAVVDAMMSLNVPVESVDSTYGVITSDWVRKGENDANMPSLSGYTRYRFFIRMYKDGADASMSRLEVHVIGQLYEKNKWIDQALKSNKSEELFIAVEERLAAIK